MNRIEGEMRKETGQGEDYIWTREKASLAHIIVFTENDVGKDRSYVFYLGLICIQSFTVAAHFTVEVSYLFCQLHSLMGTEFSALVLTQLFLQSATLVRCKKKKKNLH